MKILVDENLSRRLIRLLDGHDAHSVRGAGWQGMKNGSLIRAAEDAGFEILLTADQNLAYQQDHSERNLALVVVNTNNLRLLQDHIDLVRDALLRCRVNSYEMLEILPYKRPRRGPVLLQR